MNKAPTLFWALTLVLLNQICPAYANSVDPDQLALSMWIYINNLHQVIWLAEN